MAIQLGVEANTLLEQLGRSLDITDPQYELAESHYKAVGDWLGTSDSPLSAIQPTIYPQGSFRLGTVVKPVTDADEFDIDLVCELELVNRDNIEPHLLKTLVGNRLKANSTYEKMLTEKDRCWRLNYADGTSFHMDVIPAIPNRLRAVPQAPGPVFVTDKARKAWVSSNPIGYAEWFKERMKVRLYEGRVKLAKSLEAQVEQIPEYKVKTPLQRAVQLLKRDRNEAFQQKPKLAHPQS